MKSRESAKIDWAFADLKDTLADYQSVPAKNTREKRMRFLAVAKAFEMAVEYAWKELRRRTTEEGLVPRSPKEAVRYAARMDMVENPEQWIEFIVTRNEGVHDYLSMSEEKYAAVAQAFLDAATKSLQAPGNAG